MRSFISCAAASRCGFCRATCRRGARSSAGSADGVTRACSRRSTTCSSWLIARGSAARRRPRPRCSTARASRPPRAAAREATTQGKKGKGRKRQVMVDTDGRGLILEPQPADIQDRDGAPGVLRLSRRSFPFIAKAFADSGYAGERPASATCIAIEIVRKPPDQVGFAVHPRRWVVERFFAWISRNRRLWKDPEATLASARAFLYAASVMLLTRRLARLS